MQTDLDLKRKQAIWETPRNIAIMLGAWAALMAAIFGVLGYKIGDYALCKHRLNLGIRS